MSVAVAVVSVVPVSSSKRASSSATAATDAHVRYRAVELMTQWLPRRPDFRVTLEHVAESDEEERIRERARAAL